nr:hypothetical protein [Chloroflexota bacterium]
MAFHRTVTRRLFQVPMLLLCAVALLASFGWSPATTAPVLVDHPSAVQSQSTSTPGSASPVADLAVAAPLEIDGETVTAIVPAAPGARLIYATAGGEFYRSDSGGQQWELAGEAPPAGQIAAAADDAPLLLAGDRPPCGRGGPGEPLSRSEDGGVTWNTVEGVEGLRPLAVWGEVEVAIGASCAGLHISTDGGLTWQPLDLLEPGFDVTAFAVVPDETSSGSHQALIAHTSEGGTSRLRLLDVTDPAQPVVGDVLREFWGLGALAGRGDIYLLGAADGVWISIDAGQEWTQRRVGLEEVTLS